MAIDFEGLITEDNSMGVTEIGLAVLAPDANCTISPDVLKSQGRTPQAFFEQNTIESYWNRITLVSLLQSIQHRLGGPLILLGFDLLFELTIMHCTFPRLPGISHPMLICKKS